MISDCSWERFTRLFVKTEFHCSLNCLCFSLKIENEFELTPKAEYRFVRGLLSTWSKRTSDCGLGGLFGLTITFTSWLGKGGKLVKHVYLHLVDNNKFFWIFRCGKSKSYCQKISLFVFDCTLNVILIKFWPSIVNVIRFLKVDSDLVNPEFVNLMNFIFKQLCVGRNRKLAIAHGSRGRTGFVSRRRRFSMSTVPWAGFPVTLTRTVQTIPTSCGEQKTKMTWKFLSGKYQFMI